MGRKYLIPESVIYRINIIFKDWFCKQKAFFRLKEETTTRQQCTKITAGIAVISRVVARSNVCLG
jgi:hypothetical protein